MKSAKTFLTAIGSLALMGMTSPSCRPTPPVACRLGTEWKTVDRFAGPTDTRSSAQSAASNARAVFVVGDDAILEGSVGFPVWTVRRSKDRGETWVTVDSFRPGIDSGAQGVATDPRDGTVYVAGISQTARGWNWVVRKSKDDGATWTTADTFVDEGHSTMATSVAVGGDGTVIVAGFSTFWSTTGDSRSRWLVRRSTDGGTTWTTVETFLPETGAEAKAVAVASDGGVFIGGHLMKEGSNTWIVRHSITGTGPWTEADTFRASPELGSELHGLAARDDGRVYAVGRARIDGGTMNWVTRRSSKTDPASWRTVDLTGGGAGLGAEANGVGFARGGKAFVAGFQRVPFGESDGLAFATRSGFNATFNTVDFLFPEAAESSGGGIGVGVTKGAEDDIFVVGFRYESASNRTRWLVRRLKCE